MTNLNEELDAHIDRTIVVELPGWCTPAKGKRIARLARDARAHLCVELGVFGGRSLAAIAYGLRQNGFGRVHGVDPFTKSAAVEGTNDRANEEWWKKIDYEEIRNKALRVIADNGLNPFVTFLRSKSEEVVDRYEDGSIDILHQDSNHSTEVSTAEVRAWMPKLRLGGFWIFDDIDWETTRNAQQMLLDHGFHCLEKFDTWAIFQSVGTTIKGR